MNKKIINNKIVIATHNDGKVREIKDILRPFNLKLLINKDFNLKEPEENGDSFEKNALIKSYYSARKTGYVALSDDSGLCIKALDDQPGINSARLAGKNKNFAAAMNLLHSKMIKLTNTSCKFVCALSLCWPNGDNITTRGEVYGNFVWPPRGNLGFGYDPIFKPIGMKKTFGELNPKIKHSISHRNIAFQKLIEKFNFSN